jgi:hypothetical protein
MDYEQKNPVPIPAAGSHQAVRSTMDTVFDWKYALEEKKLLALYEKGKTMTWNASDLDWSTDVDVERLTVMSNIDQFMNDVMQTPRRAHARRSDHVSTALERVHAVAVFARGTRSVDRRGQDRPDGSGEEAKFYAANQVADEARHVEVYHRYLTEKLGLSYEVHPSLNQLLGDIVSDSRWDITYLGMQIMVEGLALAAFGLMQVMMQHEPLILDITSRIMQDESRHVAFGVLSLQKLYTKELSSKELAEREDFVIESAHLMYERLISEPVFERLGWDKSLWLPWSRNTPFQKGFRQMTFSKIVPNLKRLGLLTPRIRETFAKLDVLRYENEKDSVEQPEVTPPADLVRLLSEGLVVQNTA